MTKDQIKTAYEYLDYIHPKTETSCICSKNPLLQVHDLCVIIPCYNNEKYILKCVESVLNQKTSYSFHVIVIDDGSTDKSGEILDSISSDKLTVIHQENQGVSCARNKALSLVDGKYIFFLDSDDYLPDNCLHPLLEKAFSDDADIVEGSFLYLLEDNTTMIEDSPLSVGSVNPLELKGYACGKVIKSVLFENIVFPDNYWYEDGIMAYLIYPRCTKTFRIEAYSYIYRQNPLSFSNNFASNVKSIDAYWLREILFSDMEKLGIFVDDRLYEQLIDEISLTFMRTYEMDDMVKTAIFILTTTWFNPLAQIHDIANPYKRIIQQALLTENYNLYVSGCINYRNSLRGNT